MILQNTSIAVQNTSTVEFDVHLLRLPSALLFIIATVSIPGNSLLIYANLVSKEIRHDQWVIPALALNDAMQAVGTIGLSLIPYFYSGGGLYQFTQRQCAGLLSFIGFAFTATPLYTVELSFIRLIGFKMPVFYAKRLRSRGFILLLHSCTVAFSAYFPLHLVLKSRSSVKVPICLLETLGIPPPQLLAPILLLLILSTGIVNGALLYTIRKRKSQASTMAARRDLKLANSVVIISIVYLSSFSLSMLVIMVLKKLDISVDTRVSLKFGIGMALPALNGASNYFIYVSRSEEYRNLIWPRFFKNTMPTSRFVKVAPIPHEASKQRKQNNASEKEKYPKNALSSM